MANDKRPYGSGEVLKLSGGRFAIRWREAFTGPDGKLQTRKRYETLGEVSLSKAARKLKDRINESSADGASEQQAAVLFKDHAERWKRDILPTYKHSVQLGHGTILKLHLLPKFGERPIAELTTPEIQEWITDLRGRRYAPNSIDHFHEVLNAILRTAMNWYGLEANAVRSDPVVPPRCRRLKCVCHG